MGLYDSGGNERVSVFTAPLGDSAVSFYDEKKKVRVMLGSGFGARGALVITNTDGEAAAGLLVENNGNVILEAGEM